MRRRPSGQFGRCPSLHFKDEQHLSCQLQLLVQVLLLLQGVVGEVEVVVVLALLLLMGVVAEVVGQHLQLLLPHQEVVGEVEVVLALLPLQRSRWVIVEAL